MNEMRRKMPLIMSVKCVALVNIFRIFKIQFDEIRFKSGKTTHNGKVDQIIMR